MTYIVSTVTGEILSTVRSDARVSAIALESLNTIPSDIFITTVGIEVLRTVKDASQFPLGRYPLDIVN